MIERWNFGYNENSVSTYYNRKFSSLGSSYRAGSFQQNRTFAENDDFHRGRSWAKPGQQRPESYGFKLHTEYY